MRTFNRYFRIIEVTCRQVTWERNRTTATLWKPTGPILATLERSSAEIIRKAGFEPWPNFAIANRSPSDPASVGARLISYNTNTLRRTPSTDLVSVVGRLSATRRGYTDAGSVQAKAGYEFSAVAHQSVVHRRRVGGARMRHLAALKSSQEYKVSIVCSTKRVLNRGQTGSTTNHVRECRRWPKCLCCGRNRDLCALPRSGSRN